MASMKLSNELIMELAFTEEERKELERARKMPVTFDEDCPETTPERAVKFRRVNQPQPGCGIIPYVAVPKATPWLISTQLLGFLSQHL